MTSGPKPIPPSFREARRRLDEALLAVRESDPQRYAEHMALVASVAERAEQWREGPERLPRGVGLVEMTDGGHTVHAIDWGTITPPIPPIALHDRALTVELAWTAFMLRRPWAIDDDRLRALVDQPPIPHAAILGHLLSMRFAEWIRRAFATLTGACLDSPPEEGFGALQGMFESIKATHERYRARASLSVYELSGVLDVEEPDAGLGQEFARWQWMLYDYVGAWNPRLHERLHVIEERYGIEPQPADVTEAWQDLVQRRQLDACVGVLLARAAMLDPRPRPSAVLGFVDPMATRAVGSFAWWCGWALEAWESERRLGDRLPSGEIDSFVNSARQWLQRLDAGLCEVLVDTFPALAP